jgi:hypothetical protein
MSASTAHKETVLRYVEKALSQIPEARPSDLPPTELIPDVPAWHGFEHELWRIGEEVRHVISEKTTLQEDREIYSRFLEIARNRAAIRGRQSWVLLFAYKPCASWAAEIAGLLPDTDIEGYVISALCKMKAPGFSEDIRPYQDSEITWIRKKAKHYLEFDESQNKAVVDNRLPRPESK